MVEIRRERKSLRDITWQEFVDGKVSDVYTWPYLPSGMLKKTKKHDQRKSTDEIVKFQGDDWKEVEDFVREFSEKQKTVLSWILAALIAVMGNLAVNLAFAFPIFETNLYWVFLLVIIVIVMTIAYLKFLPKITAHFRFIPFYISFPKGYEQHITQAPCTKVYSKIIFDFGTLDQKVTNFGVLVRTAILKDHLCSSLEKASYVHISDIIDIGEGIAYFVGISTNGIKPWLDPHGSEKIKSELRGVVDALFYARMKCSVRQFELDSNEWNIHGCYFVDGVSEWDLKDMQISIINRLKSGYNRPNLP